MKLYAIILLVTLAGCTTKVVRPEVVSVERQKPAEAVLECPALTALESGSFESVVLKLEDVSTKYNLCRSKHKQLVDWIDSK